MGYSLRFAVGNGRVERKGEQDPLGSRNQRGIWKLRIDVAFYGLLSRVKGYSTDSLARF